MIRTASDVLLNGYAVCRIWIATYLRLRHTLDSIAISRHHQQQRVSGDWRCRIGMYSSIYIFNNVLVALWCISVDSDSIKTKSVHGPKQKRLHKHTLTHTFQSTWTMPHLIRAARVLRRWRRRRQHHRRSDVAGWRRMKVDGWYYICRTWTDGWIDALGDNGSVFVWCALFGLYYAYFYTHQCDFEWSAIKKTVNGELKWANECTLLPSHDTRT